MREPFKYTICAICGKEFIKQSGHIFKIHFADKTYNCCSYRCYQQGNYVKEHEISKRYSDWLHELKG